jgi:uncharacterized protein (TIGR03067 family)
MKIFALNLAMTLIVLSGCESLATRLAATLGGTWTAVSAERDGKRADDVVGNRLTFAGRNFVIVRAGATLYRGTFTTDSSQRPAHIDFAHTDGTLNGTAWQGVYALQGNTLTIADNAPDAGRPRPGTLAAPPGSGHVLVVFKRDTR